MARAAFRWVLNVIGAAGVAVTIVLGVWPLFWPVNVPAQLLTIVLLTASYVLLMYLTRAQPSQMEQIALERGSTKFAEYYAHFYRQEGAISIFCEDTEWLEADVMKPVVEAIGGKGKKATLYLTDTSSSITDDLRKREVNIVPVPPGLALEVKMSYRVTGTDRKLIIRGAADGTARSNRRHAAEINTFTATTNADLVNLAATIFSTISATGGEGETRVAE